MSTEQISYKGYIITRDENGHFWVSLGEQGTLYHSSLEAAQEYIDYIVKGNYRRQT